MSQYPKCKCGQGCSRFYCFHQSVCFSNHYSKSFKLSQTSVGTFVIIIVCNGQFDECGLFHKLTGLFVKPSGGQPTPSWQLFVTDVYEGDIKSYRRLLTTLRQSQSNSSSNFSFLGRNDCNVDLRFWFHSKVYPNWCERKPDTNFFGAACILSPMLIRGC